MYSNFVTRKPVLNFRMTKKKNKKPLNLLACVCTSNLLRSRKGQSGQEFAPTQ